MKDLAANLTSPLKLAFGAYVLLVYSDHLCPPWWVHVIVGLLFVFGQVWHDDYWRIRLNHRADIDAARYAQRVKVAPSEIAAIRGRNAADMGLKNQ